MSANAAKQPSPVKILLGIVAVLWGLEIVDTLLLGGSLDGLGLRPRTLGGLWGLVTAPFLHAGFGHLASNTAPFLVLGALMLMRGVSDFVGATIVITLLGGLGVWIFGRSATHIGASGLIFGYLGFLLLVGFLERSILGILVSVGVGVVYGGMLWGVLPQRPCVSWEGHLFGFLAGVFAAKLMSRRS
jgi:membrane associated rhomboid family serine protease